MTTVTQRRAKVGGETGANGEWYEGGKFINTVANNGKGKGGKKSTGKQEIGPYKWEVAPNDERSIYSQFRGVFGTIQNDKAILAYGSDVERLHHVLAYYGWTVVSAQRLLDMWNDGQRWISVDDLRAMNR